MRGTAVFSVVFGGENGAVCDAHMMMYIVYYTFAWRGVSIAAPDFLAQEFGYGGRGTGYFEKKKGAVSFDGALFRCVCGEIFQKSVSG